MQQIPAAAGRQQTGLPRSEKLLGVMMITLLQAWWSPSLTTVATVISITISAACKILSAMFVCCVFFFFLLLKHDLQLNLMTLETTRVLQKHCWETEIFAHSSNSHWVLYFMLHQARKKQKQKNRKTQLAASGSRQAEGRKKKLHTRCGIYSYFIYLHCSKKRCKRCNNNNSSSSDGGGGGGSTRRE